MTSKLTACTLIENWIQTEFDDREHNCYPIYWDCQDTDCNNETECHFYYYGFVTEITINEYGRELCQMLGVGETAYSYEFDEDSNEWRIWVVVSISVRSSGKNLKLIPSSEE